MFGAGLGFQSVNTSVGRGPLRVPYADVCLSGGSLPKSVCREIGSPDGFGMGRLERVECEGEFFEFLFVCAIDGSGGINDV